MATKPTGTKDKISNVPNRFEEKKSEHSKYMKERGYTDNGDGSWTKPNPDSLRAAGNVKTKDGRWVRASSSDSTKSEWMTQRGFTPNSDGTWNKPDNSKIAKNK